MHEIISFISQVLTILWAGMAVIIFFGSMGGEGPATAIFKRKTSKKERWVGLLMIALWPAALAAASFNKELSNKMKLNGYSGLRLTKKPVQIRTGSRGEN